MYKSTGMTIRELPKTRKMAVDELHPLLKVQKNVGNSIIIEIFVGVIRKISRFGLNIWECSSNDASSLKTNPFPA